MRIEYQPKPDGMAYLNFLFREGTPDPEDLFITHLLERHPVPPKRTFECERDGERYRLLQYGECVIGGAMLDIEKHCAVIAELRSLCADALAAPGLGADRMQVALSLTAVEFHEQARLTYRDGEYAVVVDEALLRDRLLARLAEA